MSSEYDDLMILAELRDAREEIGRLSGEVAALKLGAQQSRLLQMLPLPSGVVAVVEAARAFVAAVDACDREAERTQSSQSSAPKVRYIRRLSILRDALSALETPGHG